MPRVTNKQELLKSIQAKDPINEEEDDQPAQEKKTKDKPKQSSPKAKEPTDQDKSECEILRTKIRFLHRTTVDSKEAQKIKIDKINSINDPLELAAIYDEIKSTYLSEGSGGFGGISETIYGTTIQMVEAMSRCSRGRSWWTL